MRLSLPCRPTPHLGPGDQGAPGPEQNFGGKVGGMLEVACPVSQLPLLPLTPKPAGGPVPDKEQNCQEPWGRTPRLSLELKRGPLPRMSVPEAARAGQRAFCVPLCCFGDVSLEEGWGRSEGRLGKQGPFVACAFGVKSGDVIRKENFVSLHNGKRFLSHIESPPQNV